MKTPPKLAEEATDSQLVAAFEKHLTETEAHEAAFESIGKSPKAEKCPGIEGLKTEHDEFVSDENPSPDVLDMFLTGAAARTEHYEIAAYTMAQALGEDQPRPCFPRTSSRSRPPSGPSPPSPSSWPPRCRQAPDPPRV